MVLMVLMCGVMGCGREPAAGVPDADGVTKVKVTLNWVPEPEFGGIYAAQQSGKFAAEKLDVQIMPGGAGAPTWQMVAAGQAEFGIASGDEVVIARSRGADVVALFATYQTCPQAIMVHQERGMKQLADVFAGGGTLALEKGLGYTRYLEKKYGFGSVKLVPYDGGITAFLADANYSQQCFVTSEPLAARRQGAKVRVFLVADSGYNPYTAVLIARGEYVRKNRPVVRAMVRGLRAGWAAYLADPAPANQAMAQLNRTMENATIMQTFAEAAEAQRTLVAPAGARSEDLGKMTLTRWKELAGQMLELGVIEKAVAAEACFEGNL